MEQTWIAKRRCSCHDGAAAIAAITIGGAATQYCPGDAVSRLQMAAFLHRLANKAVFQRDGNAWCATAVLGTTDAQAVGTTCGPPRDHRVGLPPSTAIAELDARGVAFAAIQELHKIIREKDAQLAERRDAIEALRAGLDAIVERMRRLENAPAAAHRAMRHRA